MGGSEARRDVENGLGQNRKRRELDERVAKLARKLEKAERARAELDGPPAADRDATGPEQPPEWAPERRSRLPVDVLEAIEQRRSIKSFTDRTVTRAEIEALLAAATLAPNHRMTEPWRFYVLGAEARRAYGDVLGARKARRVEDPEAAAAVRAKVAAEHAALPAAIAVAMTVSDDAERLREDYAATWMAVGNLSLAAVARGLGTHIKTGAVMDDPAARTAIGVPDDQRVVAFLYVGEPATLPDAKARTPASDVTVWRD